MNRIISRENDYIFIEMKVDGSVYAATYNNLLWKILHIDSLSAYISERGELRFKYGTEETGRVECGLSEIAYACYDGRITGVDTFFKELKEFREDKNNHNLTVDHLDNNLYNNTVYNLSLMDRVLNSCIKQHITARFVNGYALGCAYVNGKYRAVYERTIKINGLGNGVMTMFSICDTAEKFVDLLKTLEGTRFADGSPKESAKTVYTRDAVPITADLLKALAIQKHIAEANAEKFMPWDGGYIPDNEIKVVSVERCCFVALDA